MSDTIHSHHFIESDEVSPDEILNAVQTVLNEVEVALDRRAEQGFPIAVNWNAVRLELEPRMNGDLDIAISVPVL